MNKCYWIGLIMVVIEGISIIIIGGIGFFIWRYCYHQKKVDKIYDVKANE